MDVLAAVEVAEKVVDGANILVLVAHDDCCLLLVPWLSATVIVIVAPTACRTFR